MVAAALTTQRGAGQESNCHKAQGRQSSEKYTDHLGRSYQQLPLKQGKNNTNNHSSRATRRRGKEKK